MNTTSLNKEINEPLLITSIREGKISIDREVAKLTELACIAPELMKWRTLGFSGSIRLLQLWPGQCEASLMSQTSAMQIVSVLGGQARARGDGSVEIILSDGWTILLHRAVASFTINFPSKEAVVS